MIWVYRLGIFLTLPLILVAAIFSSKIRQGIQGRWGLRRRLADALRKAGNPRKRYWVHFSSAGELEQSLPIVDKLRTTEPDAFICLTYFSPSGARGVTAEIQRRRKANVTVSWNFADYLPWDFAWSVRSFLNILGPTRGLIIQREFWPELLSQCKHKHISLSLGAVFVSDLPWWLSGFYRWCLSHFDRLGTIDSFSIQLLQPLAPQLKLSQMGDPRAERVLQRKTLFFSPSEWTPYFHSQPTWIAASLWDQDFVALLPALRKIREWVPSARLVLVPHEPTEKRLLRWEKSLSIEGLSSCRWSNFLKNSQTHSEILLVDKVGFLAELYSIATWVFVGGSFRKRVHNIFEPLAYDCILFTGPYIQNSPEAIELQALGALSVAATPADLESVTRPLFLEVQRQAEIRKKSHSFLHGRQDCSARYVQWLLSQ